MKTRITFFLLILSACISFLSSAQMTFHATDNKLLSPVSNYNLQMINLSTGVQLQYAEQGDANGDPVIFLHGYTDSWHSFEKLLAHLPLSVHAYVLSQRGHGNSAKPGEGYTPSDFAADVAAFM
ncbi:MAG TPA: alpha/beta hydrolase, partial [Chitinophagaceae bacterium]|nr:alpha/beta hydrolase [Chitinophagaceae bacterium]